MSTTPRTLLALVLSILLLGGCKLGDSDDQRHEPTLEAKVGQMVMVGFRGLSVTPQDPIWQDIAERNLGGVVLYDVDVPSNRTQPRNIESPAQLKALTSALQGIRPDPLLIGIDQEGGIIQRLKPRYGFPDSVSHAQLGAADDLDGTYAAARAIAENLREHGININFAPVVDINTNPDNPIIARYERSFSADPAAVTRHAQAYIRAHHDVGLLTNLKHFPGHGSSTGDTHLDVTDVTHTWQPLELEPYRDLIGEGVVDLVMTAHVFNGALDPAAPATLSPAVITGLLRDELGFDGVVISDDMQMGAIVNYYGFEAALELAIAAGVDILVLSNNGSTYDDGIAARAIDHIVRLVEEGRIRRERIDQSYRRIQALKQRLAIHR